MSEISFIHAADLHLDSPFKGLSHIPESIFQDVKNSTFEALNRLVQAAITKQVDFILLVGDLFDNESQSLKAQVRLRQAFEELQRHHINVYVSYGNHDFISGNQHPVTYPDNVFIFPDENITHYLYHKDGEAAAAIYGFSYVNRSVTENKAAAYEKVSLNVPYHIAMLHGSSYHHTEHDVYAPFQLSDLMWRGFDYWALGHIHQREIIREDPPVIYPGNIQGRHRKETGEKGCYHVVLSGSESSMTFLPLQSITFNQRHVDISDCTERHQLESVMSQAIGHDHQTGAELIDLVVTGTPTQLREWESSLDDVIQLVNETMSNRVEWRYIYRYVFRQVYHDSFDELAKGGHFIGELLRHVDNVPIQPYLNELYHHKQARRYLESMSLEQEQAIKQKAKRLLVHELLNERG